MSERLRTRVAGIELANPVLMASGTFGYGREYGELFPLYRLGGIVTKGTTLRPRAGNPPPRLAETPAGMLNAIGLQNPGVDHFIENDLPYLRQSGTRIIVNVAGHSLEEYQAVASRLAGEEGIAALEVNISCPNVAQGGMTFGTDPTEAARVIAAVKEVAGQPVIAKLTPNVTDIVAIARAVEGAGADAISLINTLLGMEVDIERRRPLLANVFGGLSGPAIRPVALRMVWQVVGAVGLPVIGLGGIATWQDALAFILAGASAVQVGTAIFMDPEAPLKIIEGLDRYLEAHRESVTNLVGAARPEHPAQ